MLGLVKKDLYVLFNNKKTLLILALMTILLIVSNGPQMASILPAMLIMMSTSTFSYDDFNGCFMYTSTFPNGRKKIVGAKYISTIILTLFSILITGVIIYFVDTNNFLDNLVGMFSSSIAILILVAILYPFVFKFGMEKGRIVLLVTIVLISSLFVFIGPYLSTLFSNINLEILEKYIGYVAIIILLISLFISYNISLKIFNNKEL